MLPLCHRGPNVHCGNEGAVTVVRTSKPKDNFLDICLRNLWLVCATFNIDLRIKHIRGKDNSLADALSRQKFEQLGDVTWGVTPHTLYSLILGVPCSVNPLLPQDLRSRVVRSRNIV